MRGRVLWDGWKITTRGRIGSSVLGSESSSAKRVADNAVHKREGAKCGVRWRAPRLPRAADDR